MRMDDLLRSLLLGLAFAVGACLFAFAVGEALNLLLHDALSR